MKYENVYGPFNLPNCTSITHLADMQLDQQEFIPELPLFYDGFIIFVLLDTVYVFTCWVRGPHISQCNAFYTTVTDYCPSGNVSHGLPGEETFAQPANRATSPAVLGGFTTHLLGWVGKRLQGWSAGASCPGDAVPALPAGCCRAHCPLHLTALSPALRAPASEIRLSRAKRCSWHAQCR